MNSQTSVALLGEPILKKKAKSLVIPDDLPFALALSKKMLIMLESLGERIGLAAPQIFESVQLFIYRIPQSTHARYQTQTECIPLTTMINPIWTPLSNERNEGWEACISVPGLMGKVSRYTNISCTYTDLAGERIEIQAQGFHARVIQHEADHLDGVVFTERMKDLSTLGFEDAILKQQFVDIADVA